MSHSQTQQMDLQFQFKFPVPTREHWILHIYLISKAEAEFVLLTLSSLSILSKEISECHFYLMSY